ncbi:hypothetical protein [Mesorhizobium sp. M1A.F.Ca.ET.072.01.1.1]|uniref:hypothetical protein n=1 Tax=Mesorhizobium sp. M1A.F.Ca.ET.072.01.1.1 TaxID=2496753 RepID=UPI0011AE4FA4|nr:hypothetical protein [Mesorhizobium sp. M1A.F.Ca.ET.072.01.1.1]TIU97287.1 MAG: hypothetical protein E5W04_26435 [Mesorhizobium sp.]
MANYDESHRSRNNDSDHGDLKAVSAIAYFLVDHGLMPSLLKLAQPPRGSTHQTPLPKLPVIWRGQKRYRGNRPCAGWRCRATKTGGNNQKWVRVQEC